MSKSLHERLKGPVSQWVPKTGSEPRIENRDEQLLSDLRKLLHWPQGSQAGVRSLALYSTTCNARALSKRALRYARSTCEPPVGENLNSVRPAKGQR